VGDVLLSLFIIVIVGKYIVVAVYIFGETFCRCSAASQGEKVGQTDGGGEQWW